MTKEHFHYTPGQANLLIDAVKDYAIFALDLEGRVATWNKGAERIKQYEAKEIIGKHFSIFYTAEDQAAGKPLDELKKALMDGRIEDEGWRVKKDGTRFWANVVITPVWDQQKLIGYSKITRDLTERKASEIALKASNDLLEKKVLERTLELKESEAQFRVLADAIPHLTWIAHADGYIFWYNQRWYEFTGTEPKDMEGWGWKSVHDPRELPKVMEAWAHSIRLGEAFEMEFPLRAANGDYRWFLTRAIPVRNAQGEITRWFGTNTDVDKRMMELELANRELESFSYSVSHDLRAPLRSISGFSNRLLEHCQNRLDEDGEDSLHRIVAAAQRMGKLIDDLLNLSRVSRSVLKKQSIDLSEIALSTWADLQRLSPEREISIQIQSPLPPVQADPGLMRIVLQNLLDNARKYTSKTTRAKIEFGQTQIHSKTVYFIRDNGIGFNMQYATKLFGAFQRLHSDEEFEGTGIGLATVRRIIQRHGGEVWAEAVLHEGATFYFSFEPVMHERR